MGGDSGPHEPVHEPTTDSQFGEDETGGGGAVLAPPRHRSGLDDGGLSTDPQGWCFRHRRRHGGGLRGEPGGQSSGPSGSHQVRSLPSAAGPAGIHSQGGRLAKDARHSNLRRQGGATRCDHGAGRHLRTGLPPLLIWLPAGTVGSPSAPHSAERAVGPSVFTGCSTSTYASILIRFRTPTCERSSTKESPTESSEG